MGDRAYGQDPERLAAIARAIQRVHDLGVEIAHRRRRRQHLPRHGGVARSGMDRASADYAGMLATVLNAARGAGRLRAPRARRRACCRALDIQEVAEPYIRRRAIRHLEKKRDRHLRRRHRQPVLHDRHGGRPARLRDRRRRAADGQERRRGRARRAIRASTPDAKLIRRRSRTSRRIERGLRVMDTTALSLCMENAMPIRVFNVNDEREHRPRACDGRRPRHAGEPA